MIGLSADQKTCDPLCRLKHCERQPGWPCRCEQRSAELSSRDRTFPPPHSSALKNFPREARVHLFPYDQIHLEPQLRLTTTCIEATDTTVAPARGQDGKKQRPGSLKAISNAMKARGLTKLRFYCQLCQKAWSRRKRIPQSSRNRKHTLDRSTPLHHRRRKEGSSTTSVRPSRRSLCSCSAGASVPSASGPTRQDALQKLERAKMDDEQRQRKLLQEQIARASGASIHAADGSSAGDDKQAAAATDKASQGLQRTGSGPIRIGLSLGTSTSRAEAEEQHDFRPG
ncbi:hypothetical protein L1887_53021 [Cichorium endivia]|nr:hypothetical protein L1887_53021 [Cichorium endivia]